MSISMIPIYTIHPPIFHVCNKFEPSRPHSSWEKCDEKFSCLKIQEKEKWKIKGQISSTAWFQYTRYICPLFTCVPSFNLLGLTVLEKSVTKNFNVRKLERKKNEEIKGWIYAEAAWFRYTRYSCPLSTYVPSLNRLDLTVPEKNVTKNFNVWKLERKKNEK